MSSFLAVIVEECPNLRELGIAMNLPSEYDPKNKDDEDDEDYVVSTLSPFSKNTKAYWFGSFALIA